MTTKVKIAIAFIVVVAAFATGRYSVSQTTTTTKETVKQDDKINENQDTHVLTTTTTEKDPTGVEKTTTTTTSDTVLKETQDDTTNTNIQQTITVAAHKKVNVSILVGSNTSNLLQPPNYGASVTAEVLGPVTVGVFGLNNGTLGASLGLDF